MASIAIKGLTKTFARRRRRAGGGRRSRPRHQGQPVRHAARARAAAARPPRLRMIAGYIVPDAGTIHVNGRLLSAPGGVVPPDQRGMGMVFQNYAVWPHKTVYENVVFGLKVRKTPAAEATQEGRRHARAGQSHRPGAALSERAVRRPAAARGARAQPRGRAGNPAARRAAVQSRRQAARADARRAEAPAAPHRHHLRLCHPRPGRGAGAVRP